MLATVLAGMGGILVAPLTNLTPTGSTLLIIPALAAGLMAKFTSFGVTVFAALMIGVFQNELTNVSGRWTWLPDVGTPDALPFVVIIVVMFVVGKSLPERGAAVEGRLQSVPKSRRRIVRPVVLFTATVVALYVVSAELPARDHQHHDRGDRLPVLGRHHRITSRRSRCSRRRSRASPRTCSPASRPGSGSRSRSHRCWRASAPRRSD